jgi:hypothetical protein
MDAGGADVAGFVSEVAVWQYACRGSMTRNSFPVCPGTADAAPAFKATGGIPKSATISSWVGKAYAGGYVRWLCEFGVDNIVVDAARNEVNRRAR